MLTLERYKQFVPGATEAMEPFIAVGNAKALRIMGRTLDQNPYDHSTKVDELGELLLLSLPVSDLVVSHKGNTIYTSSWSKSAVVYIGLEHAGKTVDAVYRGGYEEVPADALYAIAQISAYCYRLMHTDSVGVKQRQIEGIETEVLESDIPYAARKILEGYALC